MIKKRLEEQLEEWTREYSVKLSNKMRAGGVEHYDQVAIDIDRLSKQISHLAELLEQKMDLILEEIRK